MKNKVSELIERGELVSDVQGSTIMEAFEDLVKKVTLPENITKETLLSELKQREQLISTAVGNGFAIPHPRYSLLKNSEDERIIVAWLKEPLAMNSPDMRPVSVLFLLLSANSGSHMDALSNLAFLFQKNEFKSLMQSVPQKSELLEKISGFFAEVNTNPEREA
ncbi:MAG: PTS sugar transporter subunit IIA [Treponemataceae bacterium]|nr:PTS sugar transporter subunit IIA [Treponemataceae bacterium]